LLDEDAKRPPLPYLLRTFDADDVVRGPRSHDISCDSNVDPRPSELRRERGAFARDGVREARAGSEADGLFDVPPQGEHRHLRLSETEPQRVTAHPQLHVPRVPRAASSGKSLGVSQSTSIRSSSLESGKTRVPAMSSKSWSL